MAITGYIRSLFADKEKTMPLFPITNTKAVINDDGVRLDDLLIYTNNEDIEATVGAVDADTLGGVSASNFVQKSDIKPQAGFIYPLATPNVPDGFLLCDGKAYSRTEYVELFEAIGTYYGEGDGSTTFNVPNLQTRVPVGAGDGYNLGAVGGEENHTLTIEEMPSHTHGGVRRNTQGGSGSASTGASSSSADTNTYTNETGGDQPHNNMQPYTVVNYIISTGKDGGIYVNDIVAGAKTFPLSVKYGGTCATTVSEARKNLGAEYKRNLLDNSDFRNPVNQRGATSYAGNGVYSIDRWLTTSSSHSVDVVDGGIVVTGAVRQYVLNIKEGDIYTIAAKDVNGNLYVYSEPYYESGRIGDPEYVMLTRSTTTGHATFQLIEHSSAWEWAALYEGEYTAETLPPYVSKGYGAELAECQRYFERLNQSTENRKIGDYITVAVNCKTCKTILNYQPKRVIPTITLPSASKLRLLGVTNDDAQALKSVSTISTNYVGINNTALYITASAVISSSKVCVVSLQCTDDGGDWYIDISADL